MTMKQLQPTKETVGDMDFYITPFPALKAANISAELASVLTPVIGALAPLAANSMDGENLMDMDVNTAAGAISRLSLDGDSIEKLIRKLLLGGNIAVEISDDTGNASQHRLDADLLNEIFCGDVQDMFVLCFYVIKLNYRGFFRKFDVLSGRLQALKKTMTQKSMGDLTTDSSENSNSGVTS